MTTPIHLSIVAPCFNEEAVLPDFIRACLKVLDAVPYAGELVLVDDGSSDQTWAIISDAGRADPRVRGIRLSRNFGHQLALSAGLAHARGERVAAIDADLQDPPDLIPEMVGQMDGGYDVIYGQRASRQGVGWFKRWCYRNFYRVLTLLAGHPIPEETGDFRVMSRRVVDVLVGMPEHQRFLRGMVSWVGFNQKAFPYDRRGREKGTSKYSWRALIRLAVDGIMSFSTQPLRFAVGMSAFLGVLAGVLMLYILLGRLLNDTIPEGWTSLAVLILFVGAIQLLTLGIVGEYIGRLYLESKKRPLYVVAETTAHEEHS